MNRAKASGQRWSASEEQLVIALHPDKEALLAALPHRTWHSIRQRARAICGAGVSSYFWTTTEDRILRRMMKEGASIRELRDALPRRTRRAICRRRHRYGGAKAAPLVRMDGGALDAVKARAVERGISMRELDRLSGSGTHFYKGQRRPVLRHIAKAAEALGGWIDVEWEPLD